MSNLENHLLIIGNGFDKAHGLPTNYDQFLNWYVSDVILPKLSTTGKFGDSIIPGMELLYNVGEDLRGLNFIDFFKQLKKYSRYSASYSDLFNAILNRGVQRDHKWADIEYVYFELLSKLFTANVKIERVEKLNAALTQFRHYLNRYLNKVEKIKFNKISFLDNYINGVCRNRNDINNVMILNFNYTNTIYKYFIQDLGNRSEVNFHENIHYNQIHGSIQNEESMILGYGDLMDGEIQRIFSDGANEYLYNLKNMNYQANSSYQKLMGFLRRDNVVVHVLGHSLEKSDRFLLNKIFDHENVRTVKLFTRKLPNGANDFRDKNIAASRIFKKRIEQVNEIISVYDPALILNSSESEEVDKVL